MRLEYLPIELIEHLACLLAPRDILVFRKACPLAFRALSANNRHFWRRYMEDRHIRKLKKLDCPASVARFVTSHCMECQVRGSRTIYPFQGGLRLCRPCVYQGTINAHYLRDLPITFEDLPANHAVLTSFGRNTPTKWFWLRDVEKRITEKTGFPSLKDYREYLFIVAQRKVAIARQAEEDKREARRCVNERLCQTVLELLPVREQDGGKLFLTKNPPRFKDGPKSSGWFRKRAGQIVRNLRASGRCQNTPSERRSL
jgi:hypothetical protein